MAGISCLLIDKAAYGSQEFVMKAIRPDVINRVEVSPPPFLSQIPVTDVSEYQTDDTTVFMVQTKH